MLPFLLLLASGSGSFNATLGELQPLDAGSALPNFALQPASAIAGTPGSTGPVVVWRDGRLGPWLLSAATPDGTQVVAIERDGELMSPQVTSSDDELWFAWESRAENSKSTVKVCSRALRIGVPTVSCLHPLVYPGARLPRFRTNGDGNTAVRLGMVWLDGGLEIDPRSTAMVPPVLPFTGANTVDYSFIDPIASGFGIFVQDAMPDGGSQLSLNGMVQGLGSQPRISSNGVGERVWVDERGEVRRASSPFTFTEVGRKPWSSGDASVWLTESGALRTVLTLAVSITQPPTDTIFVDHASWRSGAGLGIVVERQNTHGRHDLDLLSQGVGTVAPMDLLRESIAGDPRGSMNRAGQAMVAWRSALGLELAVIEAGGERDRLTRTGGVRDFATTMTDDVGMVVTVSETDAVMVERFERGSLSLVATGQTAASEVAIANNGEDVQVGSAGPAGVALFSTASSGKILNQRGLAGSNLHVDCLWKGICAAVWQRNTDVPTMQIAPGRSVSMPPTGTIVGLTHEEQGFVAVLDENGLTTVRRVFPDAGTVDAARMRIAGERQVLIPGTPSVLVWQIDSSVRAMRLDTFEELEVASEMTMRLRDGSASNDVGHQDDPIDATLFFETLTLDGVYALPVRFKFSLDEPIDAGMVTVDAGGPDAGEIDGGHHDGGIDAGPGEDGGIVESRPREFVSCGCNGTSPALGLLFFVVLLVRGRQRR